MYPIQFHHLSKDGFAFFRKAQSINFQPAINALGQQGFTSRKKQTVLSKYLCFLTLTYIYPTLALVPSQSIDLVQHALMSDPLQYEQTMKQLNHCIDHVSYVEGDELDRENFAQQFRVTQSLFQSTFGIEMAEKDVDSDHIGGCHIKGLREIEPLQIEIV